MGMGFTGNTGKVVSRLAAGQGGAAVRMREQRPAIAAIGIIMREGGLVLALLAVPGALIGLFFLFLVALPSSHRER